MRENDLTKLLRLAITDLMQRRYSQPLGVKLREQPTQSGRPTGPTAFTSTILTKRIGWPRVVAEWDKDEARMVQVETVSLETTVQFSVQTETSTDPAALTAADICLNLTNVLQSPDFRALTLPDATVLRITDVREMPYKNENDQWERVSVFDLIVKHHNIYRDSVPVISKFEFRFQHVPDFPDGII